MAKVSKKTLGRRRRGALYVLLLLIIGIIVLIVQCSSGSEPSTRETGISISPTEMETTTAATNHITTQTTMTTALSTEVNTENEISLEELPAEASIDVEPILQLPELPTGCEVTSLTMALNYAGFAVDKTTLTSDYLICADPYTATFGEAFIGSPYDETAWGCYAPVIVKTAQVFLDEMDATLTAYDLTGSDFETLLWEVANGTPVITWVSINMTDNIEERYYWTTEDGKDAVFLVNEHCVVLCGYDTNAGTVLVCDPLAGLVEYDMDVFQDRFERMYSQAVVIR